MVPPERDRRYGGVIRRLGTGGSGSPAGQAIRHTTLGGLSQGVVGE